MKVLLTGFDPFNNAAINPAEEILNRIDTSSCKNEVIKLLVPTSFSRSFEIVKQAIDTFHPDIILSLGQAGGRKGITVERIGINLKDCSIPDNDGQCFQDEKIDSKGEDGLFATLDTKAICRLLNENHIPAALSYSAGTFVCNYLLYSTLNYIKENNLPIQAGFIHVPFLPEQISKHPELPSMDLDTMIKAVSLILESMG